MLSPFPIIEVPPDAAQSQEAMGSKRKFWYTDPDHGDCLFKEARPGSGEDWSEKVAAELCHLLHLPHATYELATWNQSPGIISPNLLPKHTVLLHGNDILAGLVSSYPQNQGYRVSQHTLSLVLTAIKQSGLQIPPNWEPPAGLDNAVSVFVGYLLLDAWIGNGDRHHENWGFIVPEQGGLPTLAPTYDHASCLGRELQDSKRQQRLAQKTVQDYARKSRSAFYHKESDTKAIPTFEVFQTVAQQYSHSANCWLNQLAQISPQQVQEVLDRIPSTRLSRPALDFAIQMLDFNKNRLLPLRETLT